MFGVPDPKFGEEVCAWIVLKPGQSASADEMQAYCRGQIAHYKVPRYIRFVPEFPLTATGKPQKFVMREADETRAGPHRGRERVAPAGGHPASTVILSNAKDLGLRTPRFLAFGSE